MGFIAGVLYQAGVVSSVIREVSSVTAHILFSVSWTNRCGCAYLCIFGEIYGKRLSPERELKEAMSGE